MRKNEEKTRETKAKKDNKVQQMKSSRNITRQQGGFHFEFRNVIGIALEWLWIERRHRYRTQSNHSIANRKGRVVMQKPTTFRTQVKSALLR